MYGIRLYKCIRVYKYSWQLNCWTECKTIGAFFCSHYFFKCWTCVCTIKQTVSHWKFFNSITRITHDGCREQTRRCSVSWSSFWLRCHTVRTLYISHALILFNPQKPDHDDANRYSIRNWNWNPVSVNAENALVTRGKLIALLWITGRYLKIGLSRILFQ